MSVSCVLACFLTLGQMPPRPWPSVPAPSPLSAGRGSVWQIAPLLNPAQELVYRGLFREEATGTRVQFNRTYRLEMRVFVQEARAEGYELALLTVIRARDAQGAPPPGISDTAASAARLELLRLDRQGKWSSDPSVSLTAPLEGAPSLECGMFVPAPREHIGLEQDWQVPETNRPLRSWRSVGSEMVNGTSCLKLVGSQQSDDWDRPRADRTAWRRTDTVWLVPRLWYATRVERQIELREPARKEPTQRSTLRYDLESSLSHPGPLFDGRNQEILQARALSEAAAPLLRMPQKYATQISTLLGRVAHHLETQTPTPYREAIIQLRRRLEAAQRGEAPLEVREVVEDRPTLVNLGQAAPDFVTTQFAPPGSAKLRTWFGRPIVLVFYQPSSPVAEPLLTFAQQLARGHADRVTVLLLSVSDDAQAALRQRSELRLDLPILSGSGLRISYGIETTPKMVLLDASGILRGSFLGWGRETPAEILAELKTWLHVPPVNRVVGPGEKFGNEPPGLPRR